MKLGIPLWIVCGIALALEVSAGTPKASPPNILFILADQWRAQAFSYAGDTNAQTPHLDTLARESVRFVNAVAGVPVCCPALHC